VALLCKNCGWGHLTWILRFGDNSRLIECRLPVQPGEPENLTSGGPLFTMATVRRIASDGNGCGKDGKHFAPKAAR